MSEETARLATAQRQAARLAVDQRPRGGKPAADATDSPLGLLPTEIIYLRIGDDDEAHELHVRRTAETDRPYVAWVARLTVSKTGSPRARRLDRTIRTGGTPWAAANAASIAAGWFTTADLAEGRRMEQIVLDTAERARARTVAEGRHLSAVPPLDDQQP